MAHYRIVTDRYAGYETQVYQRWFFGLFGSWVQAGGTNTHPTIEAAEKWANAHAQHVVKDLGELP